MTRIQELTTDELRFVIDFHYLAFFNLDKPLTLDQLTPGSLLYQYFDEYNKRIDKSK